MIQDFIDLLPSHLNFYDSAETVDLVANMLHYNIQMGWKHFASTCIISRYSKSWWNQDCKDALWFLKRIQSSQDTRSKREQYALLRRAHYDLQKAV